ncbi:MAG: hypothetical protein ACOYUZ_01315 [Patescibacteria group bacterium]
MILSPKDLTRHIKIVGKMHAKKPKEAANRFRKWDGETPYLLHPLWCMSTIAGEKLLDNYVRWRGMLVLLYHDVIEDTDGILPEDLPEDVVSGIKHMTYESSDHERSVIWSKPVEIRLFKLYDKTSNLLDAFETDAEKITRNLDYIQSLINDVEQNYGQLNIVIMAKSLLAAARCR